MLELTRKPHTKGTVALTVVVPTARVAAVTKAIRDAVESGIPADRVFPESNPGMILRGLRGLKEMTQAQLAAATGIRITHLSDMENGRRPIGKTMAKRLAQALGSTYKVFL